MLSSCSANGTNSAEFDNSGLSDCELVYKEFQKAEELSRSMTDSKVAERRSEITRATAVLEGRDSYQDFVTGEYAKEWQIIKNAYPNDTEYWYQNIKLERKRQVIKSTAYLWPQMSDPDLKSALRDLSQENFLESNLIAVKSVCPDVSLGTF